MIQWVTRDGLEIPVPVVINEGGLSDHSDPERGHAPGQGGRADGAVFDPVSWIEPGRFPERVLDRRAGRFNRSFFDGMEDGLEA